jgi:hypothetical protein
MSDKFETGPLDGSPDGPRPRVTGFPSLKAAMLSLRNHCPLCGKKCNRKGVQQHMWAKHPEICPGPPKKATVVVDEAIGRWLHAKSEEFSKAWHTQEATVDELGQCDVCGRRIRRLAFIRSGNGWVHDEPPGPPLMHTPRPMARIHPIQGGGKS